MPFKEKEINKAKRKMKEKANNKRNKEEMDGPSKIEMLRQRITQSSLNKHKESKNQ